MPYAQDYVNDKENITAQVATEFKFPVFYGQNYDYSFTKKIQSNSRQRKFNERTLSILNNFFFQRLEHPYASRSEICSLSQMTSLTPKQIKKWLSKKAPSESSIPYLRLHDAT
ncbi:hypothetical protein GJ496_003514 [Pomphorhynchus laevis]|nr:hypothetical protein GJ496_003514 [Pomphorhynchus laevis]